MIVLNNFRKKIKLKIDPNYCDIWQQNLKIIKPPFFFSVDPKDYDKRLGRFTINAYDCDGIYLTSFERQYGSTLSFAEEVDDFYFESPYIYNIDDLLQ